ncbi:hypothetical protein CYMTET_19693 [Cymbomonas tetramitiformis]|uniref:Uncharacterized protein n=1 Tax=Cymbomonas tetramitiformis TaxID=36881 RepID=A0AAE0G630_9CHLO|nr:hypothetical protein CYMTET_19693 [Cymbomonas tetramitiformis]
MSLEVRSLQQLGRYPRPQTAAPQHGVALPLGPTKRIQLEGNKPVHAVAARVERHAAGLHRHGVLDDCSCDLDEPLDAVERAAQIREQTAEAKRVQEEKNQRFQAVLQKRKSKRAANQKEKENSGLLQEESSFLLDNLGCDSMDSLKLAERLPPGPQRIRAVQKAQAAEERMRVQLRRAEDMQNELEREESIRAQQEAKEQTEKKARQERAAAIASMAAAQKAASEAEIARAEQDRARGAKQAKSARKARFSQALHLKLEVKVQEMAVQLPPLCGCPHETNPVDESYPYKCASNCLLYRNPQAYSVALGQVLYAYGVIGSE